MSAELSPLEQRVAAAVQAMYDAMPAEVRAECAALAELDPDGSMRGVRLHEDRESGLTAVVWANRVLGWLVMSELVES